MKLGLTDEMFSADDGSAIVFLNDTRIPGYYFRVVIAPDGEHFYELNGGSGHYAGDSMEASFVDKRNDVHYEVKRDDDGNVSINGTSYARADTPDEIDFVWLPTIRRPEYLFLASAAQVIYVSADVHHFDYATMRMFMGTLGEMLTEVPIQNVRRYRDGGTTIIDTDAGILFSPTPADVDAVATWTPTDGDPVNLLRVGNKLVEGTETESAAAVTIMVLEPFEAMA